MSFGKRLKNAASGFVTGGKTGAIVGALLPPQNNTRTNHSKYTTPFGQVTFNGNNIAYKPKYTRYQKEGLSLSDKGALDSIKALYDGVQPGSNYMNALNDLPDDLSVESLYNNPFRQSTQKLLSAPIKNRFNIDQQTLTNDLNASNQLGGSYAALRLNQLQQGYNQDLQTADLQAIKASADAYKDMLSQKQDRIKLYQQHYDSLLNQLSGFQQYSNIIHNLGSNIPNYFSSRR